jgi:hypothetical protein
MSDVKRIDHDSLAIRNALMQAIKKAPAGGTFHNAETEALYRNSFCVRLGEDQPIFTVTVSYGGALTK